MPYTDDDRRLLYRTLIEGFNRDEVAALVFGLGLNPDFFPQGTLPAFCRALVLFHEQRRQVRLLVQAIRAEQDSQPLADLYDRVADEIPLDPAPEPSLDALSWLTLDGDVRALIRQLTALSALPTDYGVRIRNFLHEYLGTSKQPVPFGGREQELAALDAWLTDTKAPPYALLAAEAGRGKSALLVRWAAQIEAWGAAHVVFIPISIRFNLVLEGVIFTALAARLGMIHREPITWGSLDKEEWRGFCQGYLDRAPPDGKPLVVILDGLDEAADWQAGADLFPRVPPPGVRAVVSARYLAGQAGGRGWRERLGWEQASLAQEIPLPQLTRAGVQAVLEAMGNPLDKLATKIDVVGKLFHLSKGDPLLVRLYVDALLPYGEQAELLQPADLDSLEPGLKGYFDRWWREQRQAWGKETPLKERRVESVLNILATARGPLDRGTLLALAPADAGVTAHTLPDALAPLARFIVGDGQHVGYTFSHPGLGFYFRDALPLAEQSQWEARFVDYGAQVVTRLNAGTLAARDVPAYMVQYYGTHLGDARASDAVCYPLSSEGWMRAWEALEKGTYAGFLNDVRRVWRQADAALVEGRGRGEAIIQQIRAASVQSSVVALSANIPPDLLALAVQHNIYTATQAIALVRQSPPDSQQGEMLSGLAQFLPSALIPSALDMACAIRDGRGCAVALSGLAPFLEEESLHTIALDAARTIEDEWNRAAALRGLIPYLSQKNRMVSLGIARAITSKRSRAAALRAVAPHLGGARQAKVFREALEAARAIEDELSRTYALSRLAAQLNGAAQAELLRESLAAGSPWNEEPWIVALRGIMTSLSAESLPIALTTAQSIRNEMERASLLCGLAAQMSGEAQDAVLQEALTVVRAIEDSGRRAAALEELVPHLSGMLRTKELGKAIAAAHAIGEMSRRAATLSRLALHLSAAERGKVLQEVLREARTIEDARSRAVTLSRIVPYLRGTEARDVLQEALAAVRIIGDEGSRVAVLRELGPRLNGAVQRESLAVVQGIEERLRMAALRAGSLYLGGGSRLERLQETPELTGNFEDWASQISSYWEGMVETKKLREALASARAIAFRVNRAAALSELVPRMSVWVATEPASALPAWSETLHQLALRPRPEFLSDLAALLPWLFALAGDEAEQVAEGIFHAIQEICGWWP